MVHIKNVNRIKLTSLLGLPPLLQKLDPLLSALTKINKAEEIKNRLTAEEFWEKAPTAYNVSFNYIEKQLETIPKTGPVIVVANHPYGCADALLMGHLLSKVRPDFKILANSIFNAFEQIRSQLILVPIIGKKAPKSPSALETLRHLKKGGLIGIFPAGGVAYLSLKEKRIYEQPWSESVIRFAQATNATVVPIHFSGGNSAKFYLLGLVHPFFRTILLTRELFGLKKTTSVRISTPIPPEEIAGMSQSQALHYFRMRCFLAAEPTTEKNNQPLFEPIVAKTPGYKEEILALPAETVLHTQGDFQIFCLEAAQIPHTLRELGRVREETFRSAGEGTRKKIDLDQHDLNYLHLIIWDKKQQEIAAAHRIGRVDQLFEKLGRKGIYTSHYFDYSDAFLQTHKMSLEVGRSFIALGYQRNITLFILLWKAIALLLQKFPQYEYLIGAVSISQSYDIRSRALLKMFLDKKSPEIKVENPLKYKLHPEVESYFTKYPAKDISQLSSLIKAIEGKDIPVLVSHYLNVGCSFLSFNVDKEFSNVLDGFIVGKISDIPEKYRAFYSKRR